MFRNYIVVIEMNRFFSTINLRIFMNIVDCGDVENVKLNLI